MKGMFGFHDYITCHTRLGIEIKQAFDELCDIIWVNGGIYERMGKMLKIIFCNCT